jgi:hypothetical protein
MVTPIPPKPPKVSRTPIGAAARKAATMAGRAKAAASMPAKPKPAMGRTKGR